jgi:4-hydroxythreonine-4-phosphate dehydrogenase
MTTATDHDETRPTIALAMGDPAGISPELTAKLLTLDEVRQAARIVVIGDRRVFDAGARIAGVEASLRTAGPDNPRPDTAEPVFIDLGHLVRPRSNAARRPARAASSR